jgi:hypothetical protein
MVECTALEMRLRLSVLVTCRFILSGFIGHFLISVRFRYRHAPSRARQLGSKMVARRSPPVRAWPPGEAETCMLGR